MSPNPRHRLTLAPYFFGHPRARSWNDTWPVKPLRVCLDDPLTPIPLPPRQVLHRTLPAMFPAALPRIQHAYTYRWTQFKHGGHRWSRCWWYSSNFHCHCRAALLSVTAAPQASGSLVDSTYFRIKFLGQCRVREPLCRHSPRRPSEC